jgi:hypothetical protein
VTSVKTRRRLRDSRDDATTLIDAMIAANLCGLPLDSGRGLG